MSELRWSLYVYYDPGAGLGAWNASESDATDRKRCFVTGYATAQSEQRLSHPRTLDRKRNGQTIGRMGNVTG